VVKAKHYLIRGRVQGVGYRWFAQRAATPLKIQGYVRNLPGGDVEVRAQADEGVLNEFKQELSRGPYGAHVAEIIEQDLPVTSDYSDFFIR
jgi:acylphosphatase